VPEEFLTTYNFEVQVTFGENADPALRELLAAFSEVSGLEINVEPVGVREGGYNQGTRQLVGKTSHPPLVFKRGLSVEPAFWAWVQRCLDGGYPLPYVAGRIRIHPASGVLSDGEPAEWRFRNGIATRVKAPDLNAASASSVPIEELHVVHEGLRRTG